MVRRGIQETLVNKAHRASRDPKASLAKKAIQETSVHKAHKASKAPKASLVLIVVVLGVVVVVVAQ